MKKYRGCGLPPMWGLMALASARKWRVGYGHRQKMDVMAAASVLRCAGYGRRRRRDGCGLRPSMSPPPLLDWT